MLDLTQEKKPEFVVKFAENVIRSYDPFDLLVKIENKIKGCEDSQATVAVIKDILEYQDIDPGTCMLILQKIREFAENFMTGRPV